MIAFILLIVILGLLIFVHELGHFLTAKNRGAYVYEFALGMGPKIFSFKRKKESGDPTLYSLRLFPIGGFCAIAGEVNEDDNEDVKLKKSDYMCNKKIWERCLILIAGVTMNFITGFLLLLISALIWGSSDQSSIVGVVPEGYPVYEAGIREGDRVLSIDGKKATNWDKIMLILSLNHDDGEYLFKVEKPNGDIEEYEVLPKIVKGEDGKESKVFGIGQDTTKKRGFVSALEYAFVKSGSIISSMGSIIWSLCTGQLSLNALSGPVGVYSVVGEAAKTSVESVIYLMAYLSLNLGFINILPFPACDGGRVLLLIIEKLRGKKMNQKIENAINSIGFALLMLLMLMITIKDVINLF